MIKPETCILVKIIKILTNKLLLLFVDGCFITFARIAFTKTTRNLSFLFFQQTSTVSQCVTTFKRILVT